MDLKYGEPAGNNARDKLPRTQVREGNRGNPPRGADSSGHLPVQPETTAYPSLIPLDIFPVEKPPQQKKWVGCLLAAGGLLGLAALIIAAICTYNYWNTTYRQAARVADTLTPTPGVLITPHSSLPLVPTSATSSREYDLTGTFVPDASLAQVDSLQGQVFKFASGSFIPLSLQDSLSSPTGLTSNPDSGVYIEFIDSSASASYVYLFFDSTMNLGFDTAFSPQLIDGRLYLQPGLEDAAIHFPNHLNVVATLEGSTELDNPNRMLVETTGSDIWLWCLHGDCLLVNEGGDSILILAMTRMLYHSATDTYEPGIPITAEELWAWQVACAYTCLTGFVTSPEDTPTITATLPITTRRTATPTPQLSATSLPADNQPTATIQPTPTTAPATTLPPYPPPPSPTTPPYPYPYP